MNCCVPVPPSSAARGAGWTHCQGRLTTQTGWRARHNGCATKVISVPSTRSSPGWPPTTVASTSWSNIAGGTVPTPQVEDVPNSWRVSQGAPAAADDFERTVLFHQFAIQMNLISPLWFAIRAYRQMREAGWHRLHRQHLQRRRASGGSPTLVSYGAAKSGLNHMTRSLAEEWGPKVG